MTLGEKLRNARLEAGLSQRQLCADVITRNMLSQIEHDTARPSMSTLQYLAGQLGKSVSYFLEDAPGLSPNRELMAHARRAYGEGDFAQTRLVLEGFQLPDEEYLWEYRFLLAMSTLDAAEQAIRAGKELYARELLKEAEDASAVLPGLQRRRLLLMASIPDAPLQQLCGELPSLDEELCLRAAAALAAKQPGRALKLLDALEQPTSRSHLLRGTALLGMGKRTQAAAALHLAEKDFPREAYAALEQCYREQGDYKKAYRYAIALRDLL